MEKTKPVGRIEIKEKTIAVTQLIEEKVEGNLSDFLDLSSDGILKGIVYSEIFGLPKSKREGR